MSIPKAYRNTTRRWFSKCPTTPGCKSKKPEDIIKVSIEDALAGFGQLAQISAIID
jgi:hypothetical protein